ncbi:hypothetical protein THRCLA_00544 [Thraustotheca clavata]|uniref:Secreted protein n=1 Tax=Thraustotheca clavata TaxID=74557 RepID=A0A1W0AAU7_9STRA|nr:hypothetical protein THRCLA_00544 [Thraustotheca clavata]
MNLRNRGTRAVAAALLTLHTSYCVNEPSNAPKLMEKESISSKQSSWIPSFAGLWGYVWPKDSDSVHFDKFMSLETQEGLMSWPSLQKGLKNRALDEIALRALTNEAIEAAKTKDIAKMNAIRDRISAIAYGSGTTPEERQAHLEKFGCVMYTDEALDIIASAAKNGIVEMGAGNGQWAKKLRQAKELDVLAFDNMSALPLNPAFFQNTRLNMEFCATDVMKGDHRVFTSQFASKLQGRALLIIFPDPSPMAKRCLEAYAKASPENDTFIYVGEGRGGANGDDAFFDLIEVSWHLETTISLPSFSKKGYERLFVFKQRQ